MSSLLLPMSLLIVEQSIKAAPLVGAALAAMRRAGYRRVGASSARPLGGTFTKVRRCTFALPRIAAEAAPTGAAQ
jgi:hypothetical protein